MSYFDKIMTNKIHGDEIQDCEDMLLNGEITAAEMVIFQRKLIDQMKEELSSLETKYIIENMGLKKDIALLRANNKD